MSSVRCTKCAPNYIGIDLRSVKQDRPTEVGGLVLVYLFGTAYPVYQLAFVRVESAPEQLHVLQIGIKR